MTGPIPILAYHRLDDARLSTSTAPHIFHRHMRWLSRHGWRSLSLDEFEFYATRASRFPSKSFLLTFDDGYRSIATEGLPILKEFNFHAVCFAATCSLQEASEGEAPRAWETGDYLSWAQAKALQETGLVDFQSHSHKHRRLHEQSESDLVLDLRASIDLLSTKLALPKTHFRHLAWPWGDSTDQSRRIATQCGFKFQYTVAREAFQHASSLEHIPRTCYDGASYADFQIQFWLQSGPLSKPWHALYRVARQLRQGGNIQTYSDAFNGPSESVHRR